MPEYTYNLITSRKVKPCSLGKTMDIVSGKVIPPYKPQTYQITKQKGTMVTAQNHEHVIVRNASKLKPIALEYKPVPECYASQSEQEDKEFPETDAPVTPPSPEAKTPRRYPVRRDRKTPAYLSDYVS